MDEVLVPNSRCKFAAENYFICLYLEPITIRRRYFDKRQSNPRQVITQTIICCWQSRCKVLSLCPKVIAQPTLWSTHLEINSLKYCIVYCPLWWWGRKIQAKLSLFCKSIKFYCYLIKSCIWKPMQLNMRILKSVYWKKKNFLQLCMINKNLQHSSFLSVWTAHRSGGPRRPTPPKLLPGSPIVPQTYLSWFHSTCLKL